MKQIHVPFIENLNSAEIESAADWLEESGREGTIDEINWPNRFPYKPITLFYIGRSESNLFIKFNVRGSMLRAIFSVDQEPVNEDSCVEFFCKMPGNDKYINFEFNCIGTCKASKRLARNKEVVPLSKEEMNMIKRFPSLGRRAFTEMEGMFEWDLTVSIPLRIMEIHPEKLPEKLLVNFYKCADGTNSPHYLSWNPVKTENPDFHRPEFFGELIFD